MKVKPVAIVAAVSFGLSLVAFTIGGVLIFQELTGTATFRDGSTWTPGSSGQYAIWIPAEPDDSSAPERPAVELLQADQPVALAPSDSFTTFTVNDRDYEAVATINADAGASYVVRTDASRVLIRESGHITGLLSAIVAMFVGSLLFFTAFVTSGIAALGVVRKKLP